MFLSAYTNIYVLMPGESKQVEAATDPIGLKIGIVYDAAPEGQILMYQMWKVKNESVLTITYVNGGDISTFGGNFNPSHKCMGIVPYILNFDRTPNCSVFYCMHLSRR